MIEDLRNYKTVKHYNISGHAHELTFSCYHHEEYLGDNSSCELFLSELKIFREEYSIQIWAYVLMPNHVHLLVGPLHSSFDISKMLNDIKGRMAKRYRDYLRLTNPDRFNKFIIFDKSKKREVFRFWQPGGGFDRNLWEPKAIHAAIGYIEANPVRKKLAINPEEYQWSSAYARSVNAGLVPDHFNIPVILPDPLLRSTGVIK